MEAACLPVNAPRTLAFGPGPGLMWGCALAFLAWVVRAATGALTPEALAAAFSQLVSWQLLAGVPLGLAIGLVRRGGPALDWPRALATGAFAGLVGGRVFGWWMEQENFFPLVAGLVQCEARLIGVGVHTLIAIGIGVSFAILFQRDLRGPGSGLGWGLAYGMLWWMLGPLTLMRMATGQPVEWTVEAGRSLFGALIGHLWYGLIVGLVHALADGVWLLLFVGSDPLNREPVSPLARALGALKLGAVAGAIVWLPTIPLFRTTGAFALLGSSVIWGMAYGLLYRRESPGPVAALTWGLVHGLVGWIVLPFTLLPLLDGDACRWSVAAAARLWPLLAPHLVQGAALAIAFTVLEARRRDVALMDPRVVASEARHRRPDGTPAPALWVLVLGLQLLVLSLLAGV